MGTQADWLGGTKQTQAAQDLNSQKSSDFYGKLTGGGALDASSLYGQAQQSANRSAQDWAQELAGSASTYRDMAAQAATGATSAYGVAANQQAALQSEANRRALEARLAQSGAANAGSGAQLSAITSALATPYAQAMTDIYGKYADQYGQAYNQQMGLGAQNAFARTGQLANMGSQALGALQDQSQQVWQPAQYEQVSGILPTALGVGTSLLGMASGNPLAGLSGLSSLFGQSGGGSQGYSTGGNLYNGTGNPWAAGWRSQ